VGDFLRLKELENIILNSSSDLMRKEGEKAFKNGLITNIKGKKLGDIYHIYGSVNNEMKSKEFNTHIKIDLSNKKLSGVKCTCDDFKELSTNGYLFMCSHLIGTAYKFFALSSKNASKGEGNQEKEGQDNVNKQEGNKTIRLARKTLENNIYYEGQMGIGGEKIKIHPNDLKSFLEGVSGEKLKFKYEHLEFATTILHKDLPLTFTLKIRDEYLVLTTHKQFPISLNSKNDVYLFNWQLYLPSENQVKKYLTICDKLKKDGEILFHKDISNYNKITSLIRGISKDINLSENVKTYASKFMKPEFYLYKIENNIYCDVKVNYGSDKIDILQTDRRKENFISDYKKEDKILMEIENCRFIKSNGRFLFIGGDEELFDILSGKGRNIHALGIVTFGKGFQEMKVYNSSLIEAAFYEKDNCYDFSYHIEGIDNRELNSLFTAYKEKNRFYKLKDKGFIDFEDDGIRNFFNILEIMNIDENLEKGLVQIEKNKALYLNENIKSKDISFIKGSEILRDIEDKLSNINNRDIFLPKGLKGVLREYQISGFKWFKGLSHLGFGGILADEMGLGKTIQTITFLLSEENKKTIIVTPTSLIYNWKDEFERFAPSLKVVIVHGEKAERYKLIDDLNEYDVILTTYGTLRMDIEQYENTIFDYCIIDEGQNIKNSLAKNTKVIKEVKAEAKFALTGTPVENNLTELWSIFDFIMPGYLYSKRVFEEKFINRREENFEELKLLIKPFVLRRTKKEVMKELPDKIEKKFLVEMTQAQKSVYKSYIKTVKEKMNSNFNGKIEVFSYLTKLRQICLDPSLIIDEYEGGSGKLNIAINLIKDHIDSDGKVLLFSQFTSVLQNIGQNLMEEGVKYLYLDGATKSKDRIKMVNEFNKGDDVKVFLISLKAGGTGLNLTSANLVIHFDPWWNPAVEDQATDRAHRIGQRNVVEVIKLVAKGTIEEKIILLQEDKKELINSIITGELKNSNLFSKLSKEEILQLFSRE